MSQFTQFLLSTGIVVAIILVLWSKIMGQTVLDTVREIKEIIQEIFTTNVG